MVAGLLRPRARRGRLGCRRRPGARRPSRTARRVIACVSDATNEFGERLLGPAGERISARDDPQRSFSGDRAQLLFDLLDGLAGDRAALARSTSSRGSSRALTSSISDACTTLIRRVGEMIPLEPLIEVCERDENRPIFAMHQTEIGSRAVRRCPQSRSKPTKPRCAIATVARLARRRSQRRRTLWTMPRCRSMLALRRRRGYLHRPHPSLARGER